MTKILVDTSVIVRYLKSEDGILADILGSYTLAVSVVTITELMASGKASDKEAKQKLEDFINDNFEVVEIDGEIANTAGDLVRTLSITLAQSYVAASSLKTDIPLLTYELKVFDTVPELKLIDI